MKVVTTGRLGRYCGDGDENQPRNGEVFIDARKFRSTAPITLCVCCANCGDYTHLVVEQAREFLAFVKESEG